MDDWVKCNFCGEKLGYRFCRVRNCTSSEKKPKETKEEKEFFLCFDCFFYFLIKQSDWDSK
jgi:hypothetical protein